jgi:hypothetical protein
VRALALTSPKIDEKLVCVALIARCERAPRQMLVLTGDKNFRGKQFEEDLAKLDAAIMRTRRMDEPDGGRTSLRSTSASSRSSRCARTSSHSSAASPAP